MNTNRHLSTRRIVLIVMFLAGIVTLLTDFMSRDDPLIPFAIVFVGSLLISQKSSIITLPLAYILGFVSFVPLSIAASLIDSRFQSSEKTIGLLGFVAIFAIPAFVILASAAALGVACGWGLKYMATRIRFGALN